MIKVLLADDEKLALDYLENIIDWEYYGFKLVGATVNAEKALSIYRKYRPELIISDVKMPGMSGIDFAQTIRENDKNSRILFLSGYRDFNYAKQAIRLGVDDYLLKSDIDEESFLKKILKLKEEIEKEQSKNHYTTSIILQELFQKNTDEKRYKGILDEDEYVKIHKKYYYLILAMKTAPCFIYEYISNDNEDKSLDDFELKKLCDEQSTDETFKTISFFPIGNGEYLLILDMTENIISQAEIYNRLYKFALRIYNNINCNSGSYFAFYYAKGSSVRQFGRFYTNNKEQLMVRYVKEQTQVIELKNKEELDKKYQNLNVPSVSADEIYRDIKNTAVAKVNQYIDKIKLSIEQEDYYIYLWYVRNIIEALSRFEKFLIGEKSGRQFLLSETNVSFNPWNPNNIVEYFQYKLDQIRSISNESKHNAYSRVITEAIKYIQKNYSRMDLSLESIANHVNLSVSWLSTKFKDEVGVGINDFLNNLRIQKAMQMFDSRDYMIYEVAEKVGFTSSQYFSKIFKQLTGLTPNEYKRETSHE